MPFINLLHGLDPVKVELNRLENEVRDKDRELSEAQAEIKALRHSERLRDKAFEKILKTGFFHADSHPGNLAIDVDEGIIYYDFGMMGGIKSFTRERLLELFYAVYEKDAKKRF